MQPQLKEETAQHAHAETEAVGVDGAVHGAVVLPSVENLLELPAAKATLTKFPPGALVLYTIISTDPPLVAEATIESVYIDLSPEKSKREYWYKAFLSKEKTAILAGETQLQWAPKCAVWMKPLQSTPGLLEWKPATIIGSYQNTANADAKYSVQVAGTGLFHGVVGDRLRYRQVVGDEPSIKTDTVNTSAVPQASPALAKPGKFESPTSVVDSVPTSIRQTLVSRTDPLPLVSSAVAQSAAHDASSETSCPAKRPAPADQHVTEASNFPHEDADHQAPPPQKQVKFADYPVSQVEAGNSRGSFSSQTLCFLQNDATAPDDIEASQAYETPPSKQVNESSQVSKSYEVPVEPVGYGNDTAWAKDGMNETEDNEVCTQTIKVPGFANPIDVRGEKSFF